MLDKSVQVLEPFKESFPGTYTVTEVIQHEDGQVAYVLGDLGAFAPEYVELVE